MIQSAALLDRSLAAVEADIEAMNPGDRRGRQTNDGCAAALRWARRQTSRSPITDRHLPSPDEDTIEAEMQEALAILERRRSPSLTATYEYAGGVEMTLMWVLGECDEPPVPLD